MRADGRAKAGRAKAGGSSGPAPRAASPKRAIPNAALPNTALPNTAIPAGVARPALILGAGEPFEPLVAALERRGFRADLAHEHRCYRFLRYEPFTLVWTGIGTGCLEPLLYELIVVDRSPEHIILAGTAGKARQDAPDGAAWIETAYAAGTGVSSEHGYHPRWPREALGALRSATSLSTDHYYGCSQSDDPIRRALRESQPELDRAIRRYWPRADLVDMETAQFYHLCATLAPFGARELSWVALKAATNAVDRPADQNERSEAALDEVIGAAVALLGTVRSGGGRDSR